MAAQEKQYPANLQLKSGISFDELKKLFAALSENPSSVNGREVPGKFFEDYPISEELKVVHSPDADENDPLTISPKKLKTILVDSANVLLEHHKSSVEKTSTKENNHIATLNKIISKYFSGDDLSETGQTQDVLSINSIFIEDSGEGEETAEPTVFTPVLDQLDALISSNPLAAWSGPEGLAHYAEEFRKTPDGAKFLLASENTQKPIFVDEVRQLITKFTTILNEKFKEFQQDKLKHDSDLFKFFTVITKPQFKVEQKYVTLLQTTPDSLRFPASLGDILDERKFKLDSDNVKIAEIISTYTAFFTAFAKADQQAVVAAAEASESATEAEEGGAEEEKTELKEEKLPQGLYDIDRLQQEIYQELLESVFQRYEERFEKIILGLVGTSSESAAYRDEIEDIIFAEISNQIKLHISTMEITVTTLEIDESGAATQVKTQDEKYILANALRRAVVQFGGKQLDIYDDVSKKVIVSPETRPFYEYLSNQLFARFINTFDFPAFDQKITAEFTKIVLSKVGSGDKLLYPQLLAKITQKLIEELTKEVPGLSDSTEFARELAGENIKTGFEDFILRANSIIGKLATTHPLVSTYFSRDKLVAALSVPPLVLYDRTTQTFIYGDTLQKWLEPKIAELVLQFTAGNELRSIIAEANRVTSQPKEAEVSQPQLSKDEQKQQEAEALKNAAQEATQGATQNREAAVRLQTAALSYFLASYELQDAFGPEDLIDLQPLVAGELQKILASLSAEELALLKNNDVGIRLKLLRKLSVRLRSNPAFVEKFRAIAALKKVSSDKLALSEEDADKNLSNAINDSENPASKAADWKEVTSGLTTVNYDAKLQEALGIIFSDSATKSINVTNIYNTIDSFIVLQYSPDFVRALSPSQFWLIFGFRVSREQLNALVPILQVYWVHRREELINKLNADRAKKKGTESDSAAEQLSQEINGTFVDEKGEANSALGKIHVDKHVQIMATVRDISPHDFLEAVASVDAEAARDQAILDLKIRIATEFLQELSQEEAEILEEQHLVTKTGAALALPKAGNKYAGASDVDIWELSAALNQAKFAQNLEQEEGEKKRARRALDRVTGIFGGKRKKQKSGTEHVTSAVTDQAASLGGVLVGTIGNLMLPYLGTVLSAGLNFIPRKYRKYATAIVLAGLAGLLFQTFKFFTTTIGGFFGGVIGGIAGGFAGFAAAGPAGIIPGITSGWFGGTWAGYGIGEGLGINHINPINWIGDAGKSVGNAVNGVFDSLKDIKIGGAGQTGAWWRARIAGFIGAGVTASYLTTAAIQMSYLQPLPTIGDEVDSEASKYVSVLKASNPEGAVASSEFPVLAQYQIAIKPKPGYELQFDVSDPKVISDVITVKYNEEKYPSGVPTAPLQNKTRTFTDLLTSNCPDYTGPQGDTYIEGLVNAKLLSEDKTTLTISEENLLAARLTNGLIFPPYCETFDQASYDHTLVTNTVSLSFTPLSNGAVLEEKATASTQHRICFGECPSQGELDGCWPVDGGIWQEPYGATYCPGRFKRYPNGAWNTHCNGGQDGHYWPDAYDVGNNNLRPIHAIEDGVVVSNSTLNSFGNHIFVQGSKTTLYAHFSRFAEGVKTGDPVKKGQVVGYVGSTGGNWDPHLHFEDRIAAPGKSGRPSMAPGYPDDRSFLRNAYAFAKENATVSEADVCKL